MKKITAVALLLVLVVSLFGCSTLPATRGTVTDGVYTNDYFGLSYVIPDGWYALTDDEYEERFVYALPTNEELAEFQKEFKDVCIVSETDAENYMIISYSMLYGKGTSDEQIKNKLAFVAPLLEFGLVSTFTIGDVTYAMTAGTSEDSTKTTYYLWDRNMIGDFRPLIWVTLDKTDSIDDIIAGFSTFTPAIES